MNQQLSRKRVLVVEDAEAIWTVQGRSLALSGLEPVICTNGPAALEALEGGRFDMVVLDLALPVVDGWGVLEAIRSDVRHAETPVLIVTARDDAETRQRARLAGADGYLGKPFEVDRFRSKVRELLERDGGRSGDDGSPGEDHPEASSAEPV